MIEPTPDTRGQRTPPTIDELYALFDEQPPDATEVTDAVVPEPYRSLLAHDRHMTVTLESHHRTPVRLEVLDRRRRGLDYGRKILLRRAEDGAVVQYGIMRIDLATCSESARERILAEDTPLGHVLIAHSRLRTITLHRLLRIEPTEEIRGHFALDEGSPLYGRVATIAVDRRPAVDLLEIVAP